MIRFFLALATVLALPTAASAQVNVAFYSGGCPGGFDANITGLTPGGDYAVITSSAAGSFVIPAGMSCSGTTTGLSGTDIAVRMTGTATGAGTAFISSSMPAAVCGASYQVIDLRSCRMSAVGALPRP